MDSTEVKPIQTANICSVGISKLRIYLEINLPLHHKIGHVAYILVFMSSPFLSFFFLVACAFLRHTTQTNLFHPTILSLFNSLLQKNLSKAF